jgi:hypothetical protein
VQLYVRGFRASMTGIIGRAARPHRV